MAKKIPKLHQYNLFKKSGSATIDLEARKKAGTKNLPKYQRNFGFTQHPTPSKSTKKAIWIEWYKDIKDFDAVSSTLDQIWSDVTGTYRPEDVEVWYGGHKGSDTDMEIELWAKRKVSKLEQ